jgi:hypothetical protein
MIPFADCSMASSEREAWICAMKRASQLLLAQKAGRERPRPCPCTIAKVLQVIRKGFPYVYIYEANNKK